MIYVRASVLCFGFSGLESCGIFAPRPGIELMPPALESEDLTTGSPEKSLYDILKYTVIKIDQMG